MKKIFSIIILLSGHCILSAQASHDSLYSIWQDIKQPDLNRVTAYYEYICNEILYSNPDSAILLAGELIHFSNTNNFPTATGFAYQIAGQANTLKSNFTLALENLEKSLATFRKNEYKKGIARSLNYIGNIYKREGNYPEALEYQVRSIKISEEILDKEQIANGMNSIGNIYQAQGNYPNALEYFERSLEIYEEIGYPFGIAMSNNNIGIIFYNQGNIPRTLKHLKKSLRIFEEMGENYGIANLLLNIGDIYKEQGDYFQARENLKKALKIFEEVGDKQGISFSLNNMGNIYEMEGDYPVALEYYEKALKIREEIGDKQGITGSLNDIGNVLGKEGKHLQALKYHEKALKISEEINEKIGIVTSLNSIGHDYYNQGNYLQSLEYCKKGYTIAKGSGLLSPQKIACQCLYDTYKNMGNVNKALEYLEKLHVIKDSLKAEETIKTLQQMGFEKQVLQDSIATAERERLVAEAHQEEVRKKDKVRNIAIGSGLFFLLLALGFFYGWRYVKRSRALVRIEKDRSDKLLLNILPEAIAEELKQKGRAEPRNFDMASILFTDFKGFTAASAKLSANELVSEINICFEAFDLITGKYQIEKIKTIGDAYMAAGGLPVTTNDSAKKTVLAALEMQDFIIKRKAENDGMDKLTFEMRVGIHTGPVVAGIAGVKKFQYDIWGDTVNTASRMESSGEVGKVNISHTTYAIIKDDPEFTFETRGKIIAKGKGEMEMYFVEKALSPGKS
ncbi:MAG: tetratricopeptide repeat protein [Bacteroidetes bacterium]|nr:tetratricopeptide repeat protein [Bacteroidota bacterium]